MRRYNEALVDAYLRPDPELMARHAAPKEQQRIREYVFFLLKEKHLLRCELHDVQFIETTVADGAATVRARENWTCQKISSETRQPAEEFSPFKQEVVYKLEKLDGRWVVASVEVDQHPKPPPAES